MGILPLAEGTSAASERVEGGSEKSKRLASDPLTEAEGLDLVGILSAIDETAYVWDCVSDVIEWESNAREILGVAADDMISTGTAFKMLISPEHLSRHVEAFDPSGGVRQLARGDCLSHPISLPACGTAQRYFSLARGSRPLVAGP